MSNEIASASSHVFPVVLIAMLVAECEQAVPPSALREAADASQPDPPDIDRKRSDAARRQAAHPAMERISR